MYILEKNCHVWFALLREDQDFLWDLEIQRANYSDVWIYVPCRCRHFVGQTNGSMSKFVHTILDNIGVYRLSPKGRSRSSMLDYTMLSPLLYLEESSCQRWLVSLSPLNMRFYGGLENMTGIFCVWPAKRPHSEFGKKIIPQTALCEPGQRDATSAIWTGRQYCAHRLGSQNGCMHRV